MSQRGRHAAVKSKRPSLDRIALVGSTATLSTALVLAGINVYSQADSSSSQVQAVEANAVAQPTAAAQTAPRKNLTTQSSGHKAAVTKKSPTKNKPRSADAISAPPVTKHATHSATHTPKSKPVKNVAKPKSSVALSSAHVKVVTRKYIASRPHSARVTASRMRTIVALKGQIASLKSQLTKPVLSGRKVIDLADNYRGVPYVSAGTSPRGFDCSGYTQYVFRQLGVTLPRVADAQSHFAGRVTRSQARAGDLVFFHSSNGYVYHVGIYAGNGRFWHAPHTGQTVRLDPLWSGKIYSFGRVGSSHVQHAIMNRIIQKTKALKVLTK